MVGKKRTYKPYSKEKIKVAVYNTITARMGAFGTESLLLQMAALNYASASAENWDKYGSLASTLYNNLRSKYGLTGYQASAVRVLVGAAIKFVKEAERGRAVTAQDVSDRLNEVYNKLNVDVPRIGDIINDIASAVATQ